jgi:ubiquinone/menaquinone biosynthesis C-methylase UbiE
MAKSDVHAVAAQGFQQAATVYEQSRPSYPSEMIDWMKTLCQNPDIVVDLGAGTGKLTRLLGSLGARELVAIEPVAGMRENLKNIPIITKIIDGSAEHIPLEDHTVDMIVCGQSFHWFATHRSLAEFNRVLKTNGVLVLAWNKPDNTGREWANDIMKYIESLKPPLVTQYRTMEWKNAFDNQNFFSTLQSKQFNHTERSTRDLLVKRALSMSFVAALPAEEQAKVVAELNRLIDSADKMRGVDELDVHHLTDVYWCSPSNSSS